MTGIKASIERIEIDYRSTDNDVFTVGIDVLDNHLSRRWLDAVIDVIRQQLHLEKNYCFLGWSNSLRNGDLICREINRSIEAINASDLGYEIQDHFDVSTLLGTGDIGDRLPGLKIDHDRFNRLHRYFEDLQGVSGAMSPYYDCADADTRWHIRQLNLLCHEFECWALSWRKKHYAPEWQRPSQLMCWLRAPRFELDTQDYELFGIDSLYRDFGGVYVGVNKAIGKHHWEVFQDEGRDSRIDELTTTTLRAQTEAAADFDIEWAQDTRGHAWMQDQLSAFRQWLLANEFDPDDPALTIGHPKVAQIDVSRLPTEIEKVWQHMDRYLDVYRIRVAGVEAVYPYRWSDLDYQRLQLSALQGS